jgi:putative transposase
MPSDLIRIYGYHDFHYITCSCYRRQQLLARATARDVFVEVLNQVLARYRFDVMGYVVMPEHFHFMISEPEKGDPSVVMKVLKQTVARRLLKDGSDHFWQKRFYDFNVYSEEKVTEKLRCMHQNPVKRGLIATPEAWPWGNQGQPDLPYFCEFFLNWADQAVPFFSYMSARFRPPVHVFTSRSQKAGTHAYG